jgi:D-arabinose 1-dehydrogenase-like Zn-dependent alcohol dehydrogenase
VVDLSILPRHLVAYGSFYNTDLKPRETVVAAPATRAYSSAAVEVASAMGARVIAVGQNLSSLKKIAAANVRVSIVQLKGNVEEDLASLMKFRPADAYPLPLPRNRLTPESA